MKSKTENILMVLKILAWLAMIGYIVQGGSQLISFVVAFFNHESAKNIYGTSLDLHALYAENLKHFIYVMSFIIALSFIHAYLWHWVIKLLSHLNLKNPFSREVAKILEHIGMQLIGIWILGVIAEQSIHWIAKSSGINIGRLNAINEYLFFAGIVYIISQVFKRGIEIQEENELTI